MKFCHIFKVLEDWLLLIYWSVTWDLGDWRRPNFYHQDLSYRESEEQGSLRFDKKGKRQFGCGTAT